MATLKALIGSQRAEQLYGLKDRLKAERVLDADPMRLNRTQFEKYLSAKAEAVILQYTTEGQEANVAYRKATLLLNVLDQQWRQAAKELNEAAV